MDSPFKSPLTSISIGPGIRGIERGVERVARLEHLAYVEIEAFIIENLVAEMECGLLDPAVIWSDAKTLPCEPFRGIVDLLLAGYPCQPFSTAGRRKGTEDPRHLYPYIERAIRITQPRICFFENVRGHVTCGLAEVIASLEGLGYRVHWGIYSAEETGAAHKRERIFILAMANDYRAGGLQLKQIGAPLNQKWDLQIHPGGRHTIKNGIGGYSKTELAHPDSERFGEKREREKWFDKSDQQLVDSPNEGLERRFEKGDHKGITRSGRVPPSKASVSRPGEPQQTWEHPRVISRKTESLMGLSAHGYHFREDILRALGNSVYEDTSELAFRDLIRKHGLSNG